MDEFHVVIEVLEEWIAALEEAKTAIAISPPSNYIKVKQFRNQTS
ncbi:MAG: hypothetical protein K0R93_1077 [Anaerosolibacter sp.]|jgi:hypothetical protein|nr:hypothetical protein [Anaerosolibacter sp.]